MLAPGSLFDLFQGGHKDLIYSGAGSVLCSLINTLPTPQSQGLGAMLPPDDELYDSSDALRGIPSFTGQGYDPETGLTVSADSAEIAIDTSKITIGRPVKGWTGKMRNIDGTDLDFKVLDVMQDRTLGVYRIRLSILKATGTGRRINRAGVGGV